MPAPGVFGVYVHIPFCTRRCDYCAFATWADRAHLVPDYVAACRIEVEMAVASGLPAASSVFFGGGTPSLLAPRQLATILGAIPRLPGAEVTVECNPETVDAGKLRGYREAGVTRLSFGVQSMVPHVLRALGREHEVSAVPRAVEAASEAGFADRYSVDLIFGASGETTADWAATMAAILALEPGPAHVSAYALTVEAGTPVGTRCGPPPRPRRPGREVRTGRRVAGRGRAGMVRDLELVPTRCRMPPQPPLLGPGRLPRVRMCGPLAYGHGRRRSPMVERAHP